MAVKCPQCGSAEFFYVQEVTEYYNIAEISDKDNSYVDLKDLVDTVGGDSYELRCQACEWEGSKADYLEKKKANVWKRRKPMGEDSRYGRPVEPPVPVEPYEPKDIYAPYTTTGEILWTGESDTTTAVRFYKEEKK